MKVNNVYSASAQMGGVIRFRCNLTDMDGVTEDVEYAANPNDPHGFSPLLIKWLEEHPDFPVAPYVPPSPPTDEEKRALMTNLSARAFRLGLLAGGKSPSMVTAAIEAMPNGPEREAALIEWEYATEFRRTHPLIATVGAVLGLTATDIDAMWTAALEI
jgi:hypothetical protein